MLKSIGYKRLDILQPSALAGPRKEFRLGEKVGLTLLSVFGFLMIGGAKKYKAIKAEKVARGMLSLAQDDKEGVFIHPSDKIQNLT